MTVSTVLGGWISGDDLDLKDDCSTVVPDSECDSATLVPENVNGEYVGMVSSLIVHRIRFTEELLTVDFSSPHQCFYIAKQKFDYGTQPSPSFLISIVSYIFKDTLPVRHTYF